MQQICGQQPLEPQQWSAEQDGQCTRRFLFSSFAGVWNMSQVFNAWRMHSLCRWRENPQMVGSERGGVWEWDGCSVSVYAVYAIIEFLLGFLCAFMTNALHSQSWHTHARALSQSLWSHAYVCVYKCHDTVGERESCMWNGIALFFIPNGGHFGQQALPKNSI